MIIFCDLKSAAGRYFGFFKFEIFNSHALQRHILRPYANFCIEIGHTIAEISQFSNFLVKCKNFLGDYA